MEIVTPGRVFFDDDVKSLSVLGIEGGFQVLPRYALYITTLLPGTLKIKTSDDREFLYAVSGGTVEVLSNKITVLADSIISKDEIDAAQAEHEKAEAEKLLKTLEPGMDKNAILHRLSVAKAKLKLLGV